MSGYARLDKVHSVYNGHLESVRAEDATLFLENGMVGVAGELVGREIRVFEKPKDETAKLVLIYNPEINYDQSSRNTYALENFKGLDGSKASRAYHLGKGDIFSVSKDMLTGIAPAKGKYVVAKKDSFKLDVVASLDSAKTYGFVGKIGDLEKFGTATVVGQAGVIQRVTEFVSIDVIKN